MLSGFGIRVSTEGDPKEALRRISETDKENRPYSIVILPWRMPGHDGMEMTRRIKNEMDLSKKPYVIMLSSYIWAGVSTLADQAGVDIFLHKPVNESVLLDTIMAILQLHASKSNDPVAEQAGLSETALKGMKILVVEDSVINQQIAETLLSEAGLIVTLAENGEAALTLLPEDAPEAPFDLVLMDLRMPVLNGLEATRRLRALCAPWAVDLPVLAMTASSRAEELDEAKNAGLDGHVGKPLDVNLLRNALLRWLPLQPMQDESMAGLLCEIHSRLEQEDLSVLAVISEAKDTLEAGLSPGRAARLLGMVQSGKLKEAAAGLRRANLLLRFMPEENEV
jgi:two-component system sensor histidine kinase/response regulator